MTHFESDQIRREKRRRMWEVIAMILTTMALVGLSRLETKLFNLSKSLSANADFFTSVVYFGLINLNVVLILLLSFLIFRNVAKLLIDRRRGVLGAKLRSKLVASLVFFAVAPTALMFFISSSFLTTSFDTWFSTRVRDTMQQTREAGAQVYKQDQRRLESLARIALQRLSFFPFAPLYPGDAPKIDTKNLHGFETEYRLKAVKVYNINGELIWSSEKDNRTADENEVREESNFIIEAIARFSSEPGLVSKGTVEAQEKMDVVKGIAPIYYPKNNQLLGVVVTEERFETQILRSIETILQEFANLRPGAQLIRLSYLILLVMMVLIILFSSTWLGFYVARGIVSPIQRLAEATREVALGNYDIHLQDKTHDETGMLIRAFNKMTEDLRSHAEKNAEFTSKLQVTNVELERRRQYMEVVLKNISAGVISVDAKQNITSINNAAGRLLDLYSQRMVGKNVREGLGENIMQNLWQPMTENLHEKNTNSAQVTFTPRPGKTLTFLATATKIFDDSGEDLGVLLVFDDATEQAKAQRVAAWREVARRIAHEIKNPMTPIKLSAQRLLRKYGNEFKGEDKEIFASCIETILVQVDSLRNMVNEFSKFARLPSIKPEPASMHDALRNVVNLYSMSYPAVRFDISGLSPQLPLLNFDKEQINRVFINIVENAVSAISENAQDKVVEFKSKIIQELNSVRIEISDNGPGIPENEREKVFEPYYSTKKDGSGLGLAIVSQIIAEHGGYVRLAEREPHGTTVVIDFPLDATSSNRPLKKGSEETWSESM